MIQLKNVEIGMPVIYMPKHNKAIKESNLGVVSSMNDQYIFVKYNGMNTANATLPEDLYPLHNRPDLIDKLGLEVKPINRVCELWIEEKEAFKNLNELL